MKKEEILRSLNTERFGRNIYAFDTLESTNVFAKSLASEDALEGTTIIAEYQSQGRGRLGRNWHSAAGKNLTFSLIVRPPLSGRFVGLISLYAALGVATVIRKKTGLLLQCKWPNDVLVDGKKLSGILSEAIFERGALSRVIIGIGVNVNETDFPADLGRPATSLALSCGREFDRVDLLCGILHELESSSSMLDDKHRHRIVENWSRQSSMLGKEIEIDQDGRVTRGIARAIAEDGQLILDTREGTKYILAGDASLV